MGKNSLIDRLTAQVGNRDTALEILRQRGHVEKNSDKLTAAGQVRDNMTAEQRALDRAHERTGKQLSSLKYDPKTNRATIKKGIK
jgi:hypothetical protein